MHQCSECAFCGNPTLLKRYEKAKAKKGYRQVRCWFKFVDPVLQKQNYVTTCWNARKHEGFCGGDAKWFTQRD